MTFRFLATDGERIEVCDECGFHGATVDAGVAADRLGRLGDAFADAFQQPDHLLRARPEPDTWCAIEYCLHTTYTLGAIAWAARCFADGKALDWAQVPEDQLHGAYDYPEHACADVESEQALGHLRAAAAATADLARALSPEQLRHEAEYAPGLVLTTMGVIRHALHDAEHHVLDVRRGIARQMLAAQAAGSL